MRRILVAAALLLPLLPGPAYAADGDPVTGYWAKTRLGPPVPVEAPTPVPEGGTWVASDPTGPVAVSALRLDLPPAAAATALRLEVDQLQGEPAIRLCPAVARWRPEQGGPITNAPAHDCMVVVEMKVEGGVLTAVLPPGFTLGALDVVLTPEPGSAFSATFKRATSASVTVTSAAPAVAPPPALVPPPPRPGSSSDGTTLPALSSGGSIETPVLGVPLAGAPQAAPAPAPAAAPAPTPPLVRAGVLPVARDDRREAIPAAALLALLVGFALRLRLQPAAAPRRIGGGAGLRVAPMPEAPVVGQVRGVGRFRGVRSTRPVRL